MSKVEKAISDYLFFQEGPGIRNYQYTTEGIKLLNVSNLTNGNIDLSNSNILIQNENDRLNAIVSEVYECIDTENYTLARTKAVTLVFKYSSDKTESDDEARQQWDKTREDLLKIIDEAEQESKKQTNTGGE